MSVDEAYHGDRHSGTGRMPVWSTIVCIVSDRGHRPWRASAALSRRLLVTPQGSCVESVDRRSQHNSREHRGDGGGGGGGIHQDVTARVGRDDIATSRPRLLAAHHRSRPRDRGHDPRMASNLLADIVPEKGRPARRSGFLRAARRGSGSSPVRLGCIAQMAPPLSSGLFAPWRR